MSKKKQSRINQIIAAIIVVVVIVGLGSWAIIANSPSHKFNVTVNSSNQITEVSYKGQAGKNALVLLQEHAKVSVKHYSFGDFVTSINGVVGNGPKYWTLYVNNKESAVGASDYVTKSTDNISWKLQ